MKSITLAEAKAHLGRIENDIETGEGVIVTRHGRPVVRMVGVYRPKKAIRSQAGFRSRLPAWSRSSSTLIRELREQKT